jgi:hypothetical protein
MKGASMDNGSGLRLFGGLLMAASGIVALINFSAIGQLPGSDIRVVGYLFNIFIFALPIALIGFFVMLAGRNKGKNDEDSEYGKKQKQIRPLL